MQRIQPLQTWIRNHRMIISTLKALCQRVGSYWFPYQVTADQYHDLENQDDYRDHSMYWEVVDHRGVMVKIIPSIWTSRCDRACRKLRGSDPWPQQSFLKDGCFHLRRRERKARVKKNATGISAMAQKWWPKSCDYRIGSHPRYLIFLGHLVSIYH